MHRKILMVFAFLAVAAMPCAAAVDYPLNLRMNYYDQELVQMEWEIKTLNLINGLYLTDDQIDQILDVLYDLEGLNSRWAHDLEQAKQNMKTAFAALRDDLVDDDMVDQKTEQRAAVAKHHFEELVIDYSAEQKKLETDLLAIFTDKQTAIADEFLPCIIPPKSANNTRIGQTGGSNPHMEQMFQRMRSMSYVEFQQMLPNFIARHLDNYEIRHGQMTLQEREAETDRLYDLALEAYEMNDVEFELSKSELAAQVMPASAKGQPKNQTQPRAQRNENQKKYQLSVVGSFLLNEKLIPILKEKRG